jgi:hypothetical protein
LTQADSSQCANQGREQQAEYQREGEGYQYIAAEIQQAQDHREGEDTAGTVA